MAALTEFGVHLLTTKHEASKLLEWGVKLDGWGFDHLKVGDHTLTGNPRVEYPNAHTLLSAIGARTRRIMVSTAVTDPYRRHPVEIAQGIATLDRLTEGRAALGIGAGEVMNLAPFSLGWEKPFRRLREAIQVIKLLWSSSHRNPVSFQGEVFSLNDAYLQLQPYQKPHPPVYVGALGPKTRKLAGELAEGWVAAASETPASLRTHLEDVKRGFRKRRGRPEDFYVSATVYTEIGDYEEAYRTVEPVARSMLAMSSEVLQRLGHNAAIPRDISVQRIRVDSAESMTRLEEAAKAIPRNLVEQIVAVGGPDECIAKLEEYLQAGANALAICSLSRDDERLYRTYAEKVIPYMKETFGADGETPYAAS